MLTVPRNTSQGSCWCHPKARCGIKSWGCWELNSFELNCSEIIPGGKYLGAKQISKSFHFPWLDFDKNAGWAGGEPYALTSRRQAFPNLHWHIQVSLWLPKTPFRGHPSSETKTLAGQEGRNRSMRGSAGLGALLGQGSWVSTGRSSRLWCQICQSNPASYVIFSYTFTGWSHVSERVVSSLPSAPAVSPSGVWPPMALSIPKVRGAVRDFHAVF